ncbi:DUF5134 domain-containing protein [Nocardia sp. BMG51109]|uniref:DUF5134 domain-containing protein n=1 Tax=Nocardia sp. BMG51109 TaxID=1056816 RepID=UPI0004BC02D1|nr:DUF5134 domain-containing protein [Nocardia sp. BMG51109]
MGAVVQSEMLRWGVAAAFVVTAVLVGTRFVTAVPDCAEGRAGAPPAVADRESEAAHLLMCLVMLAMLVLPSTVSAAVHGVLTAMVVVYSVLLVGRIAQRRAAVPPVSGGRVGALAYHVVAAAAMLWAMSGHTHGGRHDAPALPVSLLAALFAADALLMLTPGAKNLLRHALPHAPGRAAMAPHIVMDLGTAYMLVAAVVG